METQTDILIVGAGPVGLMAACQLQRFGITHRLIDRRPEPNKKSKAAGVWCRTMDIFDELGIVDEFVTQGNKTHGFQIHSGGKAFGGLDFESIESRYNYLLVIPQDKTESIMREHYTEQGGIIELGTELIELTQGESNVIATLKTADGTESLSCKYLIAADGIGSTVRHLLEEKFEGKAIPADWIVGDVTVEGDIPDDQVSAFMHETGPCVFFPFGNKRHRIIGMITERTGEQPTLEEFQSLVDERTQMPLKFSNVNDLAYFRIQERQVKDYRVGRCFFAGDAAHVHSPAGGQGMNTGVQDAHNLSWKLALAVLGRVKDDVFLDSYHAERHPVAEHVLESTGHATDFIMLKNPVLQQIRNHAMSFLLTLPVVQKKGRDELSETKICYREGPLTLSEKENWLHKHIVHDALKSGDYFVDTSVTDYRERHSIRLASKLRPAKFHLLLFEGTTQSIAELEHIANEAEISFPDLVVSHIILNNTQDLQSLSWAGSTLLDPDRSAHDAYLAREATACLIRPDGYIAYLSQAPKADQLEAYFNKIGLA